MVADHIGLSAGDAVLRGQQRALRIEHGAEVDQAAGVAQAGQQVWNTVNLLLRLDRNWRV